MLAFNADLRHAKAFKHLSARLDDWLRRRPNTAIQSRTFLGDLFCITSVAHQNGLGGTDDEMAAVTGEASEISDIHGIADKNGVDSFAGYLAKQPISTGVAMGHGDLSCLDADFARL